MIARYLILINLRLLQLRLSLLLEGDDDQGHEDVDKEEGKDDKVDDIEQRHVDPENKKNNQDGIYNR